MKTRLVRFIAALLIAGFGVSLAAGCEGNGSGDCAERDQRGDQDCS